MEVINRTKIQTLKIRKFLLTLKDFINFINPVSEHKSGIISKVAEVLKYEKVPENRVVCKYGEKGLKFYLIMHGKCHCLLPDLEIIEMTKDEYFNYLIRLKKFKEKDILFKVLALNKNAYVLEKEEISWLKGEIRKIGKRKEMTVFEDYFRSFCEKENLGFLNFDSNTEDEDENKTNWKIFENEKYQYSSVRYQQITTVKDYIKNTCPLDKNIIREKEKEKELKYINVYYYHEIKKFDGGNKFGDMALISVSQKRTATVITTDECHFGILDKRNFLKVINDVNDKEIKNDIKVIQNQQVFSIIKVNMFQLNYFNKFSKKKMKRGEILISEGNQVKNIYILKEGLFEVTITINNLDFSELISKFSGKNEKVIREKPENYKKFMIEKKELKIEIINHYDIIGLADMLINDEYIFTIKLLSSEGEVFELKREFYNSMLLTNPKIRKENENFCKKKREYWLDRIKTLYESRIDFFIKYKLNQNDKSEIPKDDEQFRMDYNEIQNDQIFKEKVNIKSTMYNKESKFLKEIDTKEKKHVKNFQALLPKKNNEEDNEGKKLYELAIYRIHEEKRKKFLGGLKKRLENRKQEIEFYRRLNTKNSETNLNRFNKEEINEANDKERQISEKKIIDSDNFEFSKNFNLDYLVNSGKIKGELFKTEVPEYEYKENVNDEKHNYLPFEKLNNNELYLKKEILNNLLYDQKNYNKSTKESKNRCYNKTFHRKIKDLKIKNSEENFENNKFLSQINPKYSFTEEFVTSTKSRNENNENKNENEIENETENILENPKKNLENENLLDETEKQNINKILNSTLVKFLNSEKKDSKKVNKDNQKITAPINKGFSVTKINFINEISTHKNTTNTEKEKSDIKSSFNKNLQNQKLNKQIKNLTNRQKETKYTNHFDSKEKLFTTTQTKENLNSLDFNFESKASTDFIPQFTKHTLTTSDIYNLNNETKNFEKRKKNEIKNMDQINNTSNCNYNDFSLNKISNLNISKKNLDFGGNSFYNKNMNFVKKRNNKIYNKEGKLVEKEKSQNLNQLNPKNNNFKEIKSLGDNYFINGLNNFTEYERSGNFNSFEDTNSLRYKKNKKEESFNSSNENKKNLDKSNDSETSKKTKKMKNAVDLMERDLKEVNNTNGKESNDDTIEKIISNESKRLGESYKKLNSYNKSSNKNSNSKNKKKHIYQPKSNLRICPERISSDKLDFVNKNEKNSVIKVDLDNNTNTNFENYNERSNSNSNICNSGYFSKRSNLKFLSNRNQLTKIKYKSNGMLEEKASTTDLPVLEVSSNLTEEKENEENKINRKRSLNKMFLIDELDKVTQSTRFSEYSSNMNMNKIVYDKVFSEMLDVKNSKKNEKNNQNHEKEFLDYLAVDKFNEVYSRSFKRTIGFFNKEKSNLINTRVVELKKIKDPLVEENYLTKIRNSSCVNSDNMQNIICNNILKEPSKTKYSSFFCNSTIGSSKDNLRVKANTTSYFLMNDKAKKIYQPKKILRYIPQKTSM